MTNEVIVAIQSAERAVTSMTFQVLDRIGLPTITSMVLKSPNVPRE
jgi:hypothetical protein